MPETKKRRFKIPIRANHSLLQPTESIIAKHPHLLARLLHDPSQEFHNGLPYHPSMFNSKKNDSMDNETSTSPARKPKRSTPKLRYPKVEGESGVIQACQNLDQLISNIVDKKLDKKKSKDDLTQQPSKNLSR